MSRGLSYRFYLRLNTNGVISNYSAIILSLFQTFEHLSPVTKIHEGPQLLF